MKITDVRAVSIDLPRPQPKTKPWRDSWSKHTPVAMPISKYRDEFYGQPGSYPGLGGGAVWAQVTAEDGSWGLGRSYFGTSHRRHHRRHLCAACWSVGIASPSNT